MVECHSTGSGEENMPMTPEEIKLQVISSVAESLALDESKINENSLLISELDADSLDIMDIMFAMEETFEISMEKEDFNFLNRINMSNEDAVIDELLTLKAKQEIQTWMPSLDIEKEIKPAELGYYLSVASLIKLVDSKLN